MLEMGLKFKGIFVKKASAAAEQEHGMVCIRFLADEHAVAGKAVLRAGKAFARDAHGEQSGCLLGSGTAFLEHGIICKQRLTQVLLKERGGAKEALKRKSSCR